MEWNTPTLYILTLSTTMIKTTFNCVKQHRISREGSKTITALNILKGGGSKQMKFSKIVFNFHANYTTMPFEQIR